MRLVALRADLTAAVKVWRACGVFEPIEACLVAFHEEEARMAARNRGRRRRLGYDFGNP